MAKSKYQQFVQDSTGATIASPTVTVYEAGSLSLAIIYSDRTGTSKTNPFTGASTGEYEFFADAGEYDIKVETGSGTQTWEYISILKKGDVVSRLNSIQNIEGLLGTEDDQQISVKGYSPDTDIAGGIFYWDSTLAKSNHDGDQVFSPSVPWNSNRATYMKGTGETDPSGNGCWVRVKESTEPYYLIWTGQSNALGSAEARAGYVGTSTDVIDGVYVFDYVTKQFKVPVWGQTPFNSSGSNNAGVEAAMEIKRITGRDVYFFLTAEGGQSIKEWVGSGTASRLWSVDSDSITDQLTDSGMPRIDAIGWMQGEQDHDGRTPGYDTTSEYRTALNTLLDQFAALPEFVDGHTQFVTSGVGEWAGQTGYARNDVLLTLNEDDREWIGNISTQGTSYNTDEGVASSHFSNDSLALIGKRIARKFLGLQTGGDVTVYTGQNGGQGARLPYQGAYVDAGTVTVDPVDIKGGGYWHVSNTVFTLHDPVRYDGATLNFNVTTNDVSDVAQVTMTTGSIYIDGETSVGSSINLDTAGIWSFTAMNGRLYLVDKPRVQKNFDEFTVDNATRAVTIAEADGQVWRVDGATITLPDPALLTGLEVTIFQYATAFGSSTISITGGASSKFTDAVGNIVNSLTLVNVGKFFVLKAMNTRWCVVAASADGPNSPSYQNSWVDFGAPWLVGKYWKDGNNIVHVEGLIKSGTTTTGTVIFNLPAGFRPSADLVMSVATSAGYGSLDITSAGDVKARTVSATWTAINFTFVAEA